jgi:hypothetical protein
MTSEEAFRGAFVSLEVNDAFTEAELRLRDGSRLCFCHRVGERWARADGSGLADQMLPLITMFRLNGKHLDIQFHDGSRWEARFRDLRRGR